MRKTAISAAIICALFRAMTVLAATPDYSGVWELEANKSTLPETMNVESIKLKIWQTNAELRIENYTKLKQSRMGASTNEKAQIAVFRLDGQEVSAVVGSGVMAHNESKKASLLADGKLSLNVTRIFNRQGGEVVTKNNEIWELMDEGKTLKITRYMETPRGATNAEMYFKKTSGTLSEADNTVNSNPRVIFDPNAPTTAPTQMLARKAIKLVKPDYPVAARPSRAQGAVTVQVTLDETGDVIAAEAISGDPLLRSAAEKAAKKSKFSPEIVNGKAVQITGVIVYNFMP